MMRSRAAYRHAEVRAAELRVLKEHWGELKNTQEVAEILRKVIRGELSHAANVVAALW